MHPPLRIVLLAGLLLAGGCSESPSDGLSDPPREPPAPAPAPRTGTGLDAFDQRLPALLDRWDVPGAAVAVTHQERLVMARGYGLADAEQEAPVQPETRFRIASLSKPITSVAVQHLAEQGVLDLEASAFGWLGHLEPPTGGVADPRLAEVTVRQLLWHVGGWDRAVSFDPMFQSQIAAATVGEPPPAGSTTVIRYMLGVPLDFDPGARYAYSNYGYNVLGRVIEQVTGQPYEAYVQQAVLAPLGITRMQIGRTKASERAEGEARYYDYPDAQQASSVFSARGTVPRPYGGFYLEAMDAHGGWIASPIDLLRFLTAVDGRPTRPDLLPPAARARMLARPAAYWSGAYHYSMGWENQNGTFSHSGALPGTATYMGCASNGVCIAALLNSWPQNRSSTFFGDFVGTLWQAAGAVADWPTRDLFADYP